MHWLPGGLGTAVSGHVQEDKTILSFFAIPVLSQADTALVFQSIGLGSQEAPDRCTVPPAQGRTVPLSLVSTCHSHVTLGTALSLPKPQFPHL